MTTPKLLALKGDFSARVRGTTGPFKPFLNATAGQISMSITTIKQKSNGNTPGTLAEDETDREAKLDITLQSRHAENLKKFLYANSVQRAAGTDIAFVLPAGEIGDIVDLGANAITATTFGALVAGVDYKVLANTGSIEYLTDIATATPGTFSHGAYVEYGIFSADSIELEVLFTAEKSKQTYKLYRVRLSPAATYQLVEDSAAYGSAQLTGTLLIDSTQPADGTLGQYGRLRSVD